ncbi:MAG: hypothetical protein OEZ43_21390 [Gammaproteobacteria bacterium]|nr:hypothetical protein [Gammaproteobacteria bacterium]
MAAAIWISSFILTFPSTVYADEFRYSNYYNQYVFSTLDEAYNFMVQSLRITSPVSLVVDFVEESEYTDFKTGDRYFYRSIHYKKLSPTLNWELVGWSDDYLSTFDPNFFASAKEFCDSKIVNSSDVITYIPLSGNYGSCTNSSGITVANAAKYVDCFNTGYVPSGYRKEYKLEQLGYTECIPTKLGDVWISQTSKLESVCPHNSYIDIEKLTPNDSETLKFTRLLEMTKGSAGDDLLSDNTKMAERWLRRKFFLTMGNGIEGEYDPSGNDLFDKNGKLIYRRSSTFRTEAYQKHLRDVWETALVLESLSDPKDIEACKRRTQEVVNHRDHYHGLTDRPGVDSKHVVNTAFDVSRITALRLLEHVGSRSNVEKFIDAPYPVPGLGWGGYFVNPEPDDVHFYLKDR